MTADVVFKPATAAHDQIIADILNQHIRAGGFTLWDRTFSLDDIRRSRLSFGDREGFFVIEKMMQTIGYGVIKKYHEKEGYRLACETSVFIKPEYTGQGIGSCFKKFLLAQCKEWQYHHIIAKIFASNSRSIHYNQKLGYEIVGTQKEVGIQDGKYVDIVIMQYIVV